MNVEINSSVRDISDFKVSVGGAVRPVNEVYISVSGAIKKVWPNKVPLNDLTWDEISEISSNGQAANYFAVGDCKEVTLSGSVGGANLAGTYSVFIIGINHNAALEGNNLIHFQFAKSALEDGEDICFVDSENYNTAPGGYGNMGMNVTNTTTGGWSRSNMRGNICGASSKDAMTTGLVNRLQTGTPDLHAVLKAVTKYTDNVGNGSGAVLSNVTSTTDYMFLLAEYEAKGVVTFANPYEADYQEQYAYYSNGNSLIKYRYDAMASSANYWLRSPHKSYIAFINVTTSGSVLFSSPTTSLGFPPCFCV